jgi:hypothetical protein
MRASCWAMRYKYTRPDSTKRSPDLLVITYGQAARMLNIGEATVKRAVTLRGKGAQNVVDSVRSGKVSVNAGGSSRCPRLINI